MFMAPAVDTNTPCDSLRPASRQPRVRTDGGAGAWWRHAVIYRIHVRSFLDSTGDGIGDLAGVRAGLPYVRRLGADGIRLTPFHPSPRHDDGSDVADHCAVDPAYGDLAEFDRLVADARQAGLRVVIDLVPNHCSREHRWFREALAAAPGGAPRSLFHFAAGRGPGGELPPNDWRSVSGGPAWSRIAEADGRPGQWYLHLRGHRRPDLNWRDPRVVRSFDRVLRFWLDRGVDGFRIEGAADLLHHPGPPGSGDPAADERARAADSPLARDRPEVHEIWRRWRSLCESYTARDGRVRLLAGDFRLPTPADEAARVGPGELHQAFSFALLGTPWNEDAFRKAIGDAMRDVSGTGSTVTWLLDNGDRARSATRHHGSDTVAGAARARAAALLMLALPGAACVHQGEELGLPEVELPGEALTDPIFRRAGSRQYVRDGCRVPLPWSGHASPFGFTGPDASAPPWLPQPGWFAEHPTDRALNDTGSFWHLYRSALVVRRRFHRPGDGVPRRLEAPPGVLAFARRDGLVCAVNFRDQPAPAPVAGTPLLTSGPCAPGTLAGNSAAWWQADDLPGPRPAARRDGGPAS
ncbi:alpha-amylase family glycosyl hydrolase, partial [Streptomyces sp. NPDC055078]